MIIPLVHRFMDLHAKEGHVIMILATPKSSGMIKPSLRCYKSLKKKVLIPKCVT